MSRVADGVRWSFFFWAYAELRPSLRYIKSLHQHSLIGCEIGVSRGANAIRMLKNLPIERLYLIDPDKQALGVSMFKKYRDKTVFFFDYSYNVYNRIPNDSLDFCYIDGEHTYEAVKQDVKLYIQKLKPGGVLCGHDFNVFGVAKAVCELSYPVVTAGYPVDWWVRIGYED